MKTKMPHKYSVKRHSRPLHRRIALHASSLILVLASGFMPPSVTYQGDVAASLGVSAKVAAPLPSAPAIITAPHDQQRVTEQTVVVSGTCPDQSYVKLYRDNILLGVAQCDAGAFLIQITLNTGANVLLARVFNITDDEGPASPPVTVYYDPPQIPPAPSQTPSAPLASPALGGSSISGGTGTAPLTINLAYQYQSRFEGEQWQWDMEINGGVTPYKVAIVWGDNQTDHIDRENGKKFTISHSFSLAGNYRPLIQVTDAQASVATFQLSAVVKAKQVLAFAQVTSSPWYVWPLYGGFAAVTVVLWARELYSLYRHIRRMLRHRHAT